MTNQELRVVALESAIKITPANYQQSDVLKVAENIYQWLSGPKPHMPTGRTGIGTIDIVKPIKRKK